MSDDNKGLIDLRLVVEVLRQHGRFDDEEGEVTNNLQDLIDSLSTPPAVMPAAPSDAVRGLGRRLAELLDEDHWAECEPLLLGIETAPRALVAKWRHAAEHLGLEGLASLADCADELEAALTQPTTVQQAEKGGV